MNTVEEFKSYVASIEAKKGYEKPLAFSLGVKRSKGDKTLDVFFPLINWENSYGTAAVFADVSTATSSTTTDQAAATTNRTGWL